MHGILHGAHDGGPLDGALGVRFGARPERLEDVGAAAEGFVPVRRAEEPGVVA